MRSPCFPLVIAGPPLIVPYRIRGSLFEAAWAKAQAAELARGATILPIFKLLKPPASPSARPFRTQNGTHGQGTITNLKLFVGSTITPALCPLWGGRICTAVLSGARESTCASTFFST